MILKKLKCQHLKNKIYLLKKAELKAPLFYCKKTRKKDKDHKPVNKIRGFKLFLEKKRLSGKLQAD